MKIYQKSQEKKKNNTPIVNYNNVVECLNQAESHSMPSKSVGNATGSPWRHDGRGGASSVPSSGATAQLEKPMKAP